MLGRAQTLLRFKDRADQLEAWSEFDLQPKSYALLTMHRPSNVDERQSLEKMIDLLGSLQAYLPIVFPVHPRTWARLDEFELTSKLTDLPNIVETPPLGYLNFDSLITGARLVLTDSGGIQEETTVLGVPCLTLRENTERPITILEGTNRLVGTNPDSILEAFIETLNESHSIIGRVLELWDGNAAIRITEILGQTRLL